MGLMFLVRIRSSLITDDFDRSMDNGNDDHIATSSTIVPDYSMVSTDSVRRVVLDGSVSP